MNPRPRDDDRAYALGVVGQPIGHSLSPVMHEAALDALGIAGAYRAYETSASELPAMVARVRAGALDGLNVTLPHKAAAAALCDRVEGAAEALGVVNTLARDEDGAVRGLNTDVEGLGRALGETWSAVRFDGRPVAIIGAGGAAHAAVLALDAFGPSEIRVYNRTLARAEALVAKLGGVARARLVVSVALVDAARDAAAVVQATSMGLGSRPGGTAWREVVDAARGPLLATAPDARLYDLVYRPRVTPWVAAAERHDRQAQSGLGMLVHQAARAFEIWTGRSPPTAIMRGAAQSALDRSGG